jgi:hypothetical protein
MGLRSLFKRRREQPEEPASSEDDAAPPVDIAHLPLAPNAGATVVPPVPDSTDDDDA